MKRIRILSLCIALMASSVVTPVYANQNLDNTKDLQISKDQAYFDEDLNAYVVSFKINSDDTIDYYSQTEVDSLNKIDERAASTTGVLNRSQPTNRIHQKPVGGSVIGPMVDYYEYYTFTKTSGPTKYIGSRRKVSADFIAPPGGGSISKSVSFSITETYSANVTYANQKSAIQAGAGFSWSKTASVGTTYTVNLTSGQSGYLSFSPYYNKVVGTLKEYSNWDGLISTSTATGYSVMKTFDGEADGLYQFIFN